MAGSPPDGVLDVEWEVPLYVIHSQFDQVVPIEPTEAAVEELRDRGIDVEFVVTLGGDHYDVSQFVLPLYGAIPWLEEVWQR
jgi:predicted esterase